ncbi:MAG: replicative DNA helicase [Ruminococcaceae bacterium]|nr:replicative DNA helicase [Oscillospiraceae bacterium]
MDLAGRTMPYSVEAEQSVLGGVLIDHNCMAAVSELIGEDDFYFEHNKAIFAVMLELFNTNKAIDIVTVSDALLGQSKLDAVGGISYLSNIASSVPTTANITQYANIVAQKALLRRLIDAGNSIVNMGYDASEEPETILEKSEKQIFDILQGKDSRSVVRINELLGETFKMMQDMAAKKGKVTGVPTGFGYLDQMTSGLQKSDLILIAARPAMGKTSFALNIAQNAAIKANVATAIFNLEMSKEQLASRIICSESAVSVGKLRDGTIDANDWASIGENMQRLAKAPIFIDDSSSVTVSEIRAKCRRLKQQHNLGLVIIDYLQLMQGTGKNKGENRQQEVSEISRSLKILAKEIQVPIITLSQLSRGPESRTNKRPMLSDLRESGAIEQDADIVMFLYRDEYYNPDSPDKNVAECIVAKHRNGETGTIKFWWDGAHTRFLHMDKQQSNEEV